MPGPQAGEEPACGLRLRLNRGGIFGCIVLCLRSPEFVIFSVFYSEKPFMAALLNHRSLVKYADFVAEAAGRQTVADVNCRFVFNNFVEFTINFSLSDGI